MSVVSEVRSMLPDRINPTPGDKKAQHETAIAAVVSRAKY